MCGFIAQLVEQRTGNAEVTGSNPVEALFLIFFFQVYSFQLLKLENLIHLQPQFKMNYFIYTSHLFFSLNIFVCFAQCEICSFLSQRFVKKKLIFFLCLVFYMQNTVILSLLSFYTVFCFSLLMNSKFQTFEVFFTVQNREHQKYSWNVIVLQGGRSQPGVGKLNSKQHWK